MRAKTLNPLSLTVDSSLSVVFFTEYLLGIFTRPVSNALAGKAIPNNKAVIHSITKYLLLLKACRFLKV